VPGQRRDINDLTRRCVASVYSKSEPGKDGLSRAFAICKASLRKSGRMGDDGRLTSAGKRRLKRMSIEPEHAKKLDAYEKILKQGRKGG
jgi:hypothetical protein